MREKEHFREKHLAVNPINIKNYAQKYTTGCSLNKLSRPWLLHRICNTPHTAVISAVMSACYIIWRVLRFILLSDMTRVARTEKCPKEWQRGYNSCLPKKKTFIIFRATIINALLKLSHRSRKIIIGHNAEIRFCDIEVIESSSAHTHYNTFASFGNCLCQS